MSADKRKPFGKQRKQAKELLALVKEGNAVAIVRVGRIIHHFDSSHFSLMTAQHVVAQEAGFKSWADMLQSEGQK